MECSICPTSRGEFITLALLSFLWSLGGWCPFKSTYNNQSLCFSNSAICAFLLRRVHGGKSPFRHRLHSAAGPQAPANLTVAIATTMDNYPAKDRCSRQSQQHPVFMLKICCPLHCRVTFKALGFFAIWCESQKEDNYCVRAFPITMTRSVAS